MDHHVLLTDGCERVAGMIAKALGVAWIVGYEFEIRSVEAHELRQLVERQHAIHEKDLVVAATKRALHEFSQLRRHGSFELEPDDRSAPAPLEHRLELAHEILSLFLDLDLGVADDTEGALPLDRIARKQPADEQARRLLERDDPRRGGAVRARQPDEALDLIGNADQRIHRLAVARAR